MRAVFGRRATAWVPLDGYWAFRTPTSYIQASWSRLTRIGPNFKPGWREPPGPLHPLKHLGAPLGPRRMPAPGTASNPLSGPLVCTARRLQLFRCPIDSSAITAALLSDSADHRYAAV